MKKIPASLMATLVILIVLSTGDIGITAQSEYPTHPITIIVPFGAGGMVDVSARLLAKKLEDKLGQPVIVINKPGAGGAVGLKHFVKAKEDGYTVLAASTSPFTAPLFLGTEPIPFEKFEPIGSYFWQQRVLFARLHAPLDTLDQLITYAREHPNEIIVGAGGGRQNQDVIMSIALTEDIKMKYVQFKSGADASAAVMGGHIDVTDAGVGSPAYLAAMAGKVKVIANLSKGTLRDFPDVPSVIDDLGYSFFSPNMYGLWHLSGVQESIIKKWVKVAKEVINDPEFIEALEKRGLTVKYRTPAEYLRFNKTAFALMKALLVYNETMKKF